MKGCSAPTLLHLLNPLLGIQLITAASVCALLQECAGT